MPKIKDGAALARWRTRMGWSADEAAEALRIKRSSLYNLEAGRKAASPTLLRLAELLDEIRLAAEDAEDTEAALPPVEEAADPNRALTSEKPAAVNQADLHLLQAARRYADSAVVLADHFRRKWTPESEVTDFQLAIPNADFATHHAAADELDAALKAGGYSLEARAEALYIRRLAESSALLFDLLVRLHKISPPVPSPTSEKPIARRRVLAADVHNGTLGDVAQTLLAGGKNSGTSLNSASLVLTEDIVDGEETMTGDGL